jgi:hypothetical protein
VGVAQREGGGEGLQRQFEVAAGEVGAACVHKGLPCCEDFCVFFFFFFIGGG